MQRIERIHADAALEAGAGQLTETPLHLVLHDEIGGTRGDVQEAIDAIAGEGRDGGSEFRILVGEIVGLATALIEGRMIGWSTGSSTTSPIR